MKKINYLLSALLLFLGVVAFVPSVSAQDAQECTTNNVSNTGPGSVNVIECSEKTTVEVICENDLSIVFNNDQVSESGEVTVDGNTIAGTGVSGDAENQNAANIDVTAVCAALATEETPVTPPAAPAPAPAPAPEVTPTPEVVTLPNTSNTTTAIESAIIASVAAGVIAVVALTGTKLYKRFNQ